MADIGQRKQGRTKRRFTVEVEIEEGQEDVSPALSRLRLFLKNARRAYGIACLRVVEIEAPVDDIGGNEAGEETSTAP